MLDNPPVEPVSDIIVDQTLPHLPQVVADMVRLQRLTGCQPGEVCILRPCDVDRSGDVWTYVPHKHNTEHHEKKRVIFIGPRAQQILLPYVLRHSTADARMYYLVPRDDGTVPVALIVGTNSRTRQASRICS